MKLFMIGLDKLFRYPKGMGFSLSMGDLPPNLRKLEMPTFGPAFKL